jgi:hypothetical protein
MDEKDLTQIEEILKQQLEKFSKKIHRQLDTLIETIAVISEKLDRIIAGYRISESRD